MIKMGETLKKNMRERHEELFDIPNLLPCPFCDRIPEEPREAGFAEGKRAWRIECKKGVRCSAIVVVFGQDKTDAAVKWNTRG